MPQRVISHKDLIESVHSATGAPFESIYPTDRSYLALSLGEVWEIVQSFGPGSLNGGKDDPDHQARRLWYAFKETDSRYACGMVRLSRPLARDLVGVLTVDDLLAEGGGSSGRLDDCVITDDLAEYAEEVGVRFGVDPRNGGVESRDLGVGIEMTLIDPQTKEVFKRGDGGIFGAGEWRVSEIRAVAVWF
ncbi:MAG: hypothetical protein METHAR1v1_910002 [Methanothrix sp.]|jgi:hypothetical protein|nr:MAG: hypothetical protein METHAR1v1_910002 [Methanothrix sp.]